MAKKKPSQLDRIEKMLTQVHGQNIALRKFVDAILDESRAYHKDPTMSIPLPHTTSEATPPAPEPWVPKVGEWITRGPNFEENRVCEYFTFARIIEVDHDYVATRVPGHGYHKWGFKNGFVRPATPEEITRCEQEQVTELQENDCVEVNSELLEELRKLGLPSYHNSALNTDSDCEYLEWDQGKLYRCRYMPGKLRPLPFDIFLKRARGTAARLKREAEEAEAKKPIAFGTRVKHIHENREYKIACDMPDKVGSYFLARPGDASQPCIYAKRHEFTILP